MDSVDRIIKNLEYQKENLNVIYNQYMYGDSQDALSEVAITNQEEDIEVNKNLNIVIFSDDFNEVLEEVFYFDNIDLNDFDEVSINESYVYSHDIDGKKITLNLLHGYFLKGVSIKLIKKIKLEVLENTSLLIALKKVNLFNRKLVDKASVRSIEVKDLDELKDHLKKFKATYYEEKFLKQNILDKSTKLELIEDNNLDSNGIKISISLDFIKEISESKLNYLEPLNTLVKKCEKEFKKVANNILLSYINTSFNDEFRYVESNKEELTLTLEEKKKLFNRMYLLVNILLDNIDKLDNSLEETKEKMIEEFKSFEENLSKSEMYIKVMESDIFEFDDITSKYLNDFKNEVINLKEV